MQHTYRDPSGGDVRVVPAELGQRYKDRGWELVDTADMSAPAQVPVDARPAKSAKVEEWRAYAINDLGLPSHEVGSLTKDELIARVG